MRSMALLDVGGREQLECFEDEDARVSAGPFLKWAGGKAAIAARLASLLPRDTLARTYREPFLGGGAMFFYLQPKRAFLSDAIAALINTYQVVQSHADALIHHLGALSTTHCTEQFYRIRARFNDERDAPRIERAAWLIYLNKTCFNGLFRTNKSGEYNVPAGRFKNPRVCDPTKLHLAAAVLGRAEIKHAHFDHLLDEAQPGDMIYMDPPYDPISRTSSFAAYSDGAFSRDDQVRLAKAFRILDQRGCLLALSNSDTPLVRELYAGFDFSPIIAPRAISSKASTRGDVSELLVRNVARYPR